MDATGASVTSREAARAARSKRGSRRQNRCVMVLPPAAELAGKRVLDLECRGGLGAFKIAELTGEAGSVVGLDRSASHIEKAIARAPEQHWAGDNWSRYLRLAVASPDDLRAAGIRDASIDIVIVNSVLNVLPSRLAALREMVRVLAPGGYLYLDAVLAGGVPAISPELATRCAREGNVFGAAPTREALGADLRAAGFKRFTCSSALPVRPERDDADLALRPYSFEAALVQAWV